MVFYGLFVMVALGPIQPPIQWTAGDLTPGVKRTGREANHKPLYSADVKNAWNYTSSPQYIFMASCLIKQEIRLRGMVLT
jgi:hypothetical protein